MSQKEYNNEYIEAVVQENDNTNMVEEDIEEFEENKQNLAEEELEDSVEETNLDQETLNKLRTDLEKNKKDLETLREKYQQELEEVCEEKEKKDFYDQVIKFESEFSKQHSDYAHATEYLRQRREKDLILWGVDDANMRKKIINSEITSYAEMALKAGINPAEKAYEMAQKWGYSSINENNKSNIGMEDLNQVKEANFASRSLSNISGHTEAELTLEALAEMSDDEFNKKWKQLTDK